MDGTAALASALAPRPPAAHGHPALLTPPRLSPCVPSTPAPAPVHVERTRPNGSPTLCPVTRPQLHGTWPSVWLTAGVPLTSCEGPGQKTDRDPDARWETRPL